MTRFYVPYGYSLGLRMSPPVCLSGQVAWEAGEGTCPPSDSVCGCQRRFSCCCRFLEPLLLLQRLHSWPPLATLQKPSPLYQCSSSVTLKILLFLLPSPQVLSLPKNLTDAESTYYELELYRSNIVLEYYELELESLRKGYFHYLCCMRHFLGISNQNSEHLWQENSAM